MFKIRINREKCNGCGICEKIYPENWKVMEKQAHVIKFKVNYVGLNKKVMDECPKKAITIVQI